MRLSFVFSTSVFITRLCLVMLFSSFSPCLFFFFIVHHPPSLCICLGVYYTTRDGQPVVNKEQVLRSVHLSCDRSSLRLTVTQSGAGFCQSLAQRTCFGGDTGIGSLM